VNDEARIVSGESDRGGSFGGDVLNYGEHSFRVSLQGSQKQDNGSERIKQPERGTNAHQVNTAGVKRKSINLKARKSEKKGSGTNAAMCLKFFLGGR